MIMMNAAPIANAKTTDYPNRIKRTVTLDYTSGPLVVDIWEPGVPSVEPPILLVHGWGGTGNYWHETAYALSENVSVIVPDLPGTGRSQPVRCKQNMFDQVAALVFLLDALEIDQVQVNGHSMGGAMSLLLAEAKPEHVERIVLTSLTFFASIVQEQIFRTVAQFFKVSMTFRPMWLVDVPWVQQMMARRFFHNVPDDAALLRQGLLDYLQLDAATAAACAADAPDPAIPHAGRRVAVPTLLIACRQDQVMPVTNVQYTVDLIPDCQLRWIENCGHMPMLEKPDEYMNILRDFMRLS